MNGSNGIREVLKKCAVGFDTQEVVEEFTVEDGELKLVKKKVTKRDIPPDIKAVKLLMDEDSCHDLLDSQLEEERDQILKLLEEEDGTNANGT